MRSPFRLAPAVLCLVALAFPATRVEAGEVDTLLREWAIASRRVDERGWKEQKQLLTKLADLDTPASRKALKKLRDKHGPDDWRRTALILGAQLKHADPDCVDEVLRWVEVQKDPLVVETLGGALAQVQKPESRAHLCDKPLRRAVPDVKQQIVRSRGLAEDREAVPALLRVLTEKRFEIKVEALDALGRLGDKRAVTPIVVFLKDKRFEVRDAAARALGFLGDRRAVTPLLTALEDDSPQVLESIVLSLGRLNDPAAIPALLLQLERGLEDDLRLADAVSIALEAISGKKIGPDLERWQDWWDAVKDRPWNRADPEQEPPEGRTIPATWYYDIPVLSSRLTFVIDTSRSMGWNDRLTMAKEELTRVLEKLPKKTSFNILGFSNGVGRWKPKLQCATKTNKKLALKEVGKFQPQSGTNTWEALVKALEDPAVDTIMFLSDGHPSWGQYQMPDRILLELRKLNRYRRVRIHVIALLKGNPPTGYAGQEDMRKAESFMRRLAKQNEGDFHLVR